MAKLDNNAGRQRALDSALHQIEKEFGTGAIMRLGDLGSKILWTGSFRKDYMSFTCYCRSTEHGRCSCIY